jgi:hypothetical protein
MATTAIAPSPEEGTVSQPGDDQSLPTPDLSIVLRGFDTGQVDDLWRRASEALAANDPGLRAAAAEALRQPLRTRFRGYDRSQVQTLFADMARLLAQV